MQKGCKTFHSVECVGGVLCILFRGRTSLHAPQLVVSGPVHRERGLSLGLQVVVPQ